MPTDLSARRPIKTRNAAWVQALARWLAGTAITPNQISVLGLFLAFGAGAALAAVGRVTWAPTWLLLILAALGIQGRLLCNLLDGLVAVEGGRASRTGPIYNELPDRLADLAILVGAGYAAGVNPVWGWLAGSMAVMTAYIRALGASIGAGQHFIGPMAKSHRMAVMTVTCLVAPLTRGQAWKIIELALILVTAGRR